MARLRRVGSSSSSSSRSSSLLLHCLRISGAIRSYHLPLFSLLFFSVVTPLIFFATTQTGISNSGHSAEHSRFPDKELNVAARPELTALEEIEKMLPKEMIDAITSKIDDSGPLSLSTEARKKRLSTSWVLDGDLVHNASVISGREIHGAETDVSDSVVAEGDRISRSGSGEAGDSADGEGSMADAGNLQKEEEHEDSSGVETAKTTSGAGSEGHNVVSSPAVQHAKLKMRVQRRLKRVRELTQAIELRSIRKEEEMAAAAQQRRRSDVFSKYSIWRKENDENSESLVRLMRDQLIMARVYVSIAAAAHEEHHRLLLRELRQRIRDSRQALGDANIDSDLPRSASERIKLMGQTLSRAREQLYDCSTVGKKLRAMVQLAEEHTKSLKKQSTFLNQLAAKTLPKGIHCLSMRLTTEYYKLAEEERRLIPGAAAEEEDKKLHNTSLFHYALFSDNVLAVSVVVNSTVINAKEPWKHVFHLVTDKLNYAAMRMWFLANPPAGNATIDVQNIDDFTWLNSSYCPVLRQLESAAMKEYYFKADRPTTIAAESSNLKYRNPKYLSMLNHLRFYLPEIYPKLDKILFLDDDIVVQKDLTPLWSINLRGKVNGAVLTCGRSFHRFDKYLNFSNPHIRRNFDPHACGWAYGMNMFDLKQWKTQDITGIYHKWQNMNEERVLWKLGTLPPGLITFYNLTFPLDKSWHVLGLGYNPSIDRGEMEGAAVLHYNGNMKPWLELGIARYKHYWTKYVNYGHPFMQQCNVN